jgi:SNF2 family DNA or RNA helicase
LHWLNPQVFTSYWRFADNYFHIDDNGYGKTVGTLRREMEEPFFRMLSPYVIRRTKAEVLPWLPDKHYIEVPCSMTEGQRKQYEQMEQEGIARLEQGSISTTNILAEFTRLTQFAFGKWVRGPGGKLVPTEDSGKLEALLDKMEEAGVFDDTSVKQLVFSQYREVTELVASALLQRGVQADIISGKQNKQGQRRAIREAFQEGTTQVLCIVTTAGGVSLTLDAADTVHMLDDMWSPDEIEQAEDRAHRASRVHQVTVYQYRSIGTIDAYRASTAAEKAVEHKRILDVRRQLVEDHKG